jgi:large subunit ribosomal protein L22e
MPASNKKSEPKAAKPSKVASPTKPTTKPKEAPKATPPKATPPKAAAPKAAAPKAAPKAAPAKGKPAKAAAPKAATPKAAPKAAAPKAAPKAAQPKAAPKAATPKATPKAATPKVAKPAVAKKPAPKAPKVEVKGEQKAQVKKEAPKDQKPKTAKVPAKTASKGAAKTPLSGKSKVGRAPLAKGAKAKKIVLKFAIDCTHPVEDGIMDAGSFEKFLHDKIKVNGKAGVLGDVVSVQRDKTKIYVTSSSAFSKRYLKYLTKKFLKKQQLRDWLRVVAANKSTFELRYFNIHENEEDEEVEEAS